MSRNPFAFLDAESKDRTLLLLLLSLIKKQGGEVSLELTDLTSIEDGASFHKYPDDSGTKLVLRYARKGAEAYFLTGEESTQAKSRSTVRTVIPRQPQAEEQSPLPRHAIHDDIDLALREDEMETRARSAQQERLRKARAESGVMPWTTRQ